MSSPTPPTKSRLSPAFWILSGLVFSIAVVFAVFNLKKNYPIHDEIFHVPTIDQFHRRMAGTDPWSLDYSQSIGPLFYFIYAAWQFLCPDLAFLRCLSLLFAFANIWLLHRILKISSSPLLFISFFAGPWMLLSAFSVHAEQMGLFLLLSAFYLLIFSASSPSRTWLRNGLGFLALACIPITRLYLIFSWPTTALEFLLRREKRIGRWIALGLTLVPILWLVWHWGGPIPPAAQQTWGQKVSFQWHWATRPFTLFAYLGLYGFPFVILLWREIKALGSMFHSVVGLMAILVGLSFSLGIPGPVNSLERALLHGSGTTAMPLTLHSLAARLPFAAGLWSFICMAALAIPRLTTDQIIRTALVGIMLYGGSLCFSGTLYVERYLLPGYPLLLLIGWGLVPRSRHTTVAFLLFLPGLALNLLHLGQK